MDPLRDAGQNFSAGVSTPRLVDWKLLAPILILVLWFLPPRYFLLLGFVPGGFGAIDLIQYWSSGSLLLKGLSPYDSVLLAREQTAVFPLASEIIQMWNPPPATVLTLPLGLFTFSRLISLWFLIQLAFYLWAVAGVSRLFPQLISGPARWVFYLVVIFFYPLVSSLGYGQISFLLLGSLVAFLFMRERSGPRSQFYAGLLLSVSIIKPHLFIFVYAEVFRQAVCRKKGGELTGLLVGVATLMTAPLLIYPTIYAEYFAAWSLPPLFWKTPTLGSWLQWGAVLFGGMNPVGREALLVRCLPGVVAAMAYLAWALSRRQMPSLYAILPLGVLVAPYGWIYDFMILLPTVAFILNESIIRLKMGDTKTIAIVLAVLLQTQVLFFVLPGSIGQDAFVWYPAVILALAIYVTRPQTRDSPKQTLSGTAPDLTIYL